MTNRRTISPRELRIAAEHADGLRKEKNLILAYRETASTESSDGRRGLVVRQTALEPGDVDLEITIQRDQSDVADAMTSPSAVRINYGNDDVDLIKDNVDALFWTESAIDKFVLPYYVSLLSESDFMKLRAVKRDPKVMAVGHYRPTVYTNNPGQTLAGTTDTTAGMLLGVLRLKSDGISDAPEFVPFATYLSEKNGPPA